MKTPSTQLNKPPSEPGWYWCRNYGDVPNQIWEAVVRIDRDESGRLFGAWMKAPGEVGKLYMEDFAPYCHWLGPISPDREIALSIDHQIVEYMEANPRPLTITGGSLDGDEGRGWAVMGAAKWTFREVVIRLIDVEKLKKDEKNNG